MEPITFKAVIHSYRGLVEQAHSDLDLGPRVRKVLVILLNTAANDGACGNSYEAVVRDPAIREAILRRFIDGQWNANVSFIVEAAAGTVASDTYGIAFERAITILRGI